jgi:hypothetical protein
VVLVIILFFILVIFISVCEIFISLMGCSSFQLVWWNGIAFWAAMVLAANYISTMHDRIIA